MAGTGIKTTKMLIMKPFSIGRVRGMSRLARKNESAITTDKESKEAAAEERGGCNWVPHHRTGIYFPEGQEWVMDDIPNNAASFDCTFWLRSIDGVDHKKHYNIDN